MTITLGIIGYSTRALLQAAVDLGYRTVCIDAFADQDTLELADECYRIDDWPSGIASCAGRVQVDGWILAGGMEHRAELLDEIAKAAPVLGASAPQMQTLRSLACWQRVCAGISGLGFPQVKTNVEAMNFNHTGRANSDGRWLRKELTSAGGMGVSVTYDSNSNGASSYWQWRIDGRSLGVSWIFRASGPKMLGVTGTWNVSDWPGPTEFIYRGSFGPLSLPRAQQAALMQLALRVAELLPDYRGWLQADFIEDEQGKLWLLEFNPRWTAGMEILHESAIAAELSPLAQHLSAFDVATESVSAWSKPSIHHFSKAIHYADRALELRPSQRRILRSLRDWQGSPDGLTQWSLADIPPVADSTPMRFQCGQPILTFRSRLLAKNG